jgi:ribosome biogenesis protein UTP30
MVKKTDELIDSHVSSNQSKLAVAALLKHALKRKSDQEQNELLPDKEQFVWLTLAVKKVYAEKKLKPFKM